MEVVILDFANENNYYDGPYDPDEPSSPACWSVMKSKPNDMEPSEESPKPQCDDCVSCWANEYGSASTGRGKACKNSRRLAIVAVDDLEDVKNAEVAFLRVPPTSNKSFDKMAGGVRKVFKRPMYGVVVDISFDEDSEYEKLLFKAVKPIEDTSILMALRELRESIEEDILSEPDPANYLEPKAVKKKTNKKKPNNNKNPNKKNKKRTVH